MRRIDLDRMLELMLQSHEGVSDLLFTVDRPLQVEAFGVLKPVYGDPPIQSLTPYQTEQIALCLIGQSRRMLKEFFIRGACDTSYSLEDRVRFRVNVFKQRGTFVVVMRKLQTDLPTIERLGLPAIFKDIAREKNGFVIVTGATGSGKTTTLAAVLEEINQTQSVHVITLEDPIEYMHHHHLATFSQRELGKDFDLFSQGLRSALRQAPKVVLVGEIRDRETLEIALTAAETGHLVLTTLHTIDAGQSINRMVGMFAQHEEQQVRARLSDTLRFVVSQRLLPASGGGRQLVLEIMGSTLRTRELVEKGETEDRNFYDIIASNVQAGWCTFDQSVLQAYEGGFISEETAVVYSTRRATVTRAIDIMKKVRSGLKAEGTSGLRIDVSSKVERR